MLNGIRPPLPDLIPISSLRRSRDEVMGELQRPRRRARNHPAVHLIDNGAGSRDASAASQPPETRKTRPERRHRKSDRRRDPRKATRSVSKHASTCSNDDDDDDNNKRSKSVTASPERPANPRVNPIFVWVRQEDSRIVDVKCEDYDKRNRILLTKTAQGWRAIPRTETLVPSLKESDDKNTPTTPHHHQQHHHHHHHRKHHHKSSKKSKKNKTSRQKSTAVQFPEDSQDEDKDHSQDSPSWVSSANINIESLLPSHTIHVRRTDTDENDQQPPLDQCSAVSADKTCDSSPLDNLLAVAELELRSNEWNTAQDEFETIAEFIQSKTDTKSEYNDEEADTALNDILSRLEESLQSPQSKTEETPDDVEIIETEPEKPEIIDLDDSDDDDDDEEEQPTDLSMKTLVQDSNDPTDLTIPKLSSPEAIQSPQPSGIPDTVTTSNVQNRSIFLESLLSSNSHKMALNSEVTIIRQKEPLDLGSKNRKSASPTVTCSEEVEPEPPVKKFKHDITLKTLLEPERTEKPITETPRLLELLRTDSQMDPLTQFKTLLTETDVPEPLMVPKDRFQTLLKHPKKEILKIIKEQPHKNIPMEQILVVYRENLLSALEGNHNKQFKKKKPTTKKNISVNDIEAATEAAFNQMLWLPYANHPEGNNNNNNQEMLQALYNSFPFVPNQINDLQMMLRVPPATTMPFPPVNFTNPLEFTMWQEAMLQANTMKQPTFENFTNYNQRLKTPQQIPQNFYTTNPYLNAFNDGTKHALTVPQFNAFHQKNLMAQQKLHQQRQSQQKQKQRHSKVGHRHHQEKSGERQPNANQPIDLSASMAGNRCKGRSGEQSRRHEDIPEVGSTTASIEDMQDAHKHLWHPLFGSKGYSPWGLPGVKATGE